MDVAYLMTWVLVLVLFGIGSCFAFLGAIFLCAFMRELRKWKAKRKNGERWYMADDGLMIAWPALVFVCAVFALGLMYAAYIVRGSVV